MWPRGPGVFLQGLAVHGLGGRQLSDAALPAAVVRQAFEYSQQTGELGRRAGAGGGEGLSRGGVSKR